MNRAAGATRPHALAIDLGSSNTVAAILWAGGEPETLPLSYGGDLMRSAVLLAPDGARCGDRAAHDAAAHPEGYIPSPKALVGGDGPTVAGRQVDVPEILAVLVRHVLDASREHTRANPDSVVLTHPEAWPPPLRRQLIEAAVLAGIPTDRVRLLSEPQAAVRSLAARDPEAATGRVAVFDFGGGTLDVAVLDPTPDGGHRVVAAAGDPALGGRDLDGRVHGWVLEQMREEAPDRLRHLGPDAPAGARHGLDNAVRSAKELLSDTSTAIVAVSTPEGETDLLLTRDDLHGLIDADLDRAVELTARTLAAAPATPDRPVLYLTGGSSRIPRMQDLLGGLARVATLDDPKTVVARGALLTPSVDADGRRRPSAAEALRPFAPEPSENDDQATRGREGLPGRPWILGAVAVALVAAIAGGVALATNHDSGSDPAPTGGQPAQSRLGPIPATVDAVLPAAFLERFGRCSPSDGPGRTWYPTTSVPKLRCTGEDFPAQGFEVSADPTALAAIRNAMVDPHRLDEPTFEVVRTGGGASPEVVRLTDPGRWVGRPSYAMAALYPDSGISVVTDEVDSKEDNERMMREAGFL